MLFDYLRLLKFKTPTLTDLSYDNQDEDILPIIDLASATDYILIGMQYPFNNFFIDMDTPNEAVSDMSLEYWNGSAWVAAVDVLDGTALAGATFGKSGHVLFSLDRQESGWSKVNNTRVQGPAELSTKDIYDLYWLKMKVSVDLDTSTAIRELGFAWTSGAKMKGLKSEIDRYLPAYATGKTTWNKEIMMACKLMSTDLKKANLIYGPQQVVRIDDFWIPATYKALWLIYSSLGPAYLETANAMAHQFYKNLNVNNTTVDVNLNGQPDGWERDSRVMTGVR